MSLSPLRPLRPLVLLRHRRLLSSAALAAVDSDTTWIQAPLTRLEPASADGTLFHVAVGVSDFPDLAASHTAAGQYLQLRLPSSSSSSNPIFLSIASPPSSAADSSMGEFEFLVRRRRTMNANASTAELLCALRSGDVVELSEVIGRGFDVNRISPPEVVSTVLLFANGSGISPIRSLIESGFSGSKRSDVRLYYGSRDIQRIAYQDRFKDWESSGVKIIPVLSCPNNRWKGERGYVQTIFSRDKQTINPSSTGAVLCGHKRMTEEVTSILVTHGVPRDKILMNF